MDDNLAEALIEEVSRLADAVEKIAGILDGGRHEDDSGIPPEFEGKDNEPRAIPGDEVDLLDMFGGMPSEDHDRNGEVVEMFTEPGGAE